MKHLFLIFVFSTILFSCMQVGKNKDNKPVPVPTFCADSAFQHIKNIVDFGARVPNSVSHVNCGLYLTSKMREYGATVLEQNAKVTRFDGEVLNIKNIIAQFNATKKERIVIYTHWDTRYQTDFETDSLKKAIPIQGANDGGSGCGIILELCRVIGKQLPQTGIDFIFFDAEDQGELVYKYTYKERTWCLGSQYWAANKMPANYSAKYGICIDLVGTKNAKFTKEDHSRHFAPLPVKYIWERAEQIGLGNYFVPKLTSYVNDDHLFVSQDAGIPSVLIIPYDLENNQFFDRNWHTQSDTLGNIDKTTLDAVGKLLLEIIYSE